MAPTAAAVLIAVVSAASASTIAPFLPYSFQAYNALEDYKVARVHATNTDAVAALGDVFMRHAVNDTFGLCLLHRHFKVRGGEVMVEVVRGNATRTEPRVLPTWEFSPTADVVPSVMGVTANGSLVPYEFLDVRESDFGAVSETTRRVLAGFYSRSEAFTPFFVDLASALDAAGLRSAFGVCVRHRDSVTSADPGGSSSESGCACISAGKLNCLSTHSGRCERVHRCLGAGWLLAHLASFTRCALALQWKQTTRVNGGCASTRWPYTLTSLTLSPRSFGVARCGLSARACVTLPHSTAFNRFLQSTATFWSFPLRCNAVGMGVGPTEGFCAECGCGGGAWSLRGSAVMMCYHIPGIRLCHTFILSGSAGMCAECACATGMFY